MAIRLGKFRQHSDQNPEQQQRRPQISMKIIVTKTITKTNRLRQAFLALLITLSACHLISGFSVSPTATTSLDLTRDLSRVLHLQQGNNWNFINSSQSTNITNDRYAPFISPHIKKSLPINNQITIINNNKLKTKQSPKTDAPKYYHLNALLYKPMLSMGASPSTPDSSSGSEDNIGGNLTPKPLNNGSGVGGSAGGPATRRLRPKGMRVAGEDLDDRDYDGDNESSSIDGLIKAMKRKNNKINSNGGANAANNSNDDDDRESTIQRKSTSLEDVDADEDTETQSSPARLRNRGSLANGKYLAQFLYDDDDFGGDRGPRVWGPDEVCIYYHSFPHSPIVSLTRPCKAK